MNTLSRGKTPNEVVTLWIDLGEYDVENLVLSSSVSTVYISNDDEQTDIATMHPYQPTIVGSRIYQTICSGSDGKSYVWKSTISVSGSFDVYQELLGFSVAEV